MNTVIRFKDPALFEQRGEELAKKLGERAKAVVIGKTAFSALVISVEVSRSVVQEYLESDQFDYELLDGPFVDEEQ